MITIGESHLEFNIRICRRQCSEPESRRHSKMPKAVNYDDQPLGHTQLLISANEIIGKRSNLSIEAESRHARRNQRITPQSADFRTALRDEQNARHGV